ncbi:MAG: LysR family transcriptional regulator, partial [Clostridia bacterium]|nr:LysR family transcriptional regulator [Clostridia bacterium]
YTELLKYPFVSYEQGKHNISFFTEEIMEISDVKKHIEISDRASLMNVLLTTDSYTVGTGIMPSTLNEGKIVSIPLESNSYYNIGYILHTDRKCSDLTDSFINMLEELVEQEQKA